MADIGSNPYNNIPVELNLGDYVVTATSFHGWETEQWWKDLGDLLYGRPGWYCHIADTGHAIEVLWSFGALGSSLFVISVEQAPAYHLYDYEADTQMVFDNIGALRQWLDENEQRHSEYPRRLRDYAADSDWALLRSLPFKADITFDGSAWIATFQQLPITYSSGSTLGEAVSNAREAITDAFDAPRTVAPNVQLVLRLDAAASAAL
jgi:hypothetical protein